MPKPVLGCRFLCEIAKKSIVWVGMEYPFYIVIAWQSKEGMHGRPVIVMHWMSSCIFWLRVFSQDVKRAASKLRQCNTGANGCVQAAKVYKTCTNRLGAQWEIC
jgi:hypothetical protein